MVKRKAKDLEVGPPAEEPRRSSRRKTTPKEEELPAAVASKTSKTAPSAKPRKKAAEKGKPQEEKVNSNQTEDKSQKTTKSVSDTTTKPPIEEPTGRQYWLMKAEPETRLEKGQDIKFSIDDLAAKTIPEPWDGIRAYPARNNLRAMKKGDLAFFYHSSCKIPAIVGIMEIVAEHTPDLTAHNPSAPYYDSSSKPDNPKWSAVHVEFRQKLATPITLKELREFGELKEMQMLKLTRLSVSKVRAEEWEFLVGEMGKRGDVVNF